MFAVDEREIARLLFLDRENFHAVDQRQLPERSRETPTSARDTCTRLAMSVRGMRLMSSAVLMKYAAGICPSVVGNCIALTSGTQWYPPSGGGTTLNSVVSDNQNTALLTGTQNLTIFRQAFIASSDVPATVRTLSLYSEAGATGNIDEPLMTWALPGESTTTATVRTAVAFIPATINIVPAPSVLTLSTLSVFAASRRRR